MACQRITGTVGFTYHLFTLDTIQFLTVRVV